MKKIIGFLTIVGILISIPLNLVQAATAYYPISFDYNSCMQTGGLDIHGDTYPAGDVEFTGIPFHIPDTGNNFWHSYYENGPNPRILSIDVGVIGVVEVHTLMNTYWGLPGPNSYAAIEFIGSEGAYYKVDLVGNNHIRDYNQNRWTTTSINGVTTVEVFNNGMGQRLDKQVFYLPDEFKTQQLDLVKIRDNGGTSSQRIFISGLTVSAVPIPGAVWLLGSGLAGLIGLKYKKKNLKSA